MWYLFASNSEFDGRRYLLDLPMQNRTSLHSYAKQYQSDANQNPIPLRWASIADLPTTINHGFTGQMKTCKEFVHHFRGASLLNCSNYCKKSICGCWTHQIQDEAMQQQLPLRLNKLPTKPTKLVLHRNSLPRPAGAHQRSSGQAGLYQCAPCAKRHLHPKVT